MGSLAFWIEKCLSIAPRASSFLARKKASLSRELSTNYRRDKDSSSDKESAAHAGKATEMTPVFTYVPYAIFSYFELQSHSSLPILSILFCYFEAQKKRLFCCHHFFSNFLKKEGMPKSLASLYSNNRNCRSSTRGTPIVLVRILAIRAKLFA
jgi:hypothetical protein